jgi:hypothetical protein
MNPEIFTGEDVINIVSDFEKNVVNVTVVALDGKQILSTSWLITDGDFVDTVGILSDVLGQPTISGVIPLTEDLGNAVGALMTNPDTHMSANANPRED